jgi:hypothetical protein
MPCGAIREYPITPDDIAELPHLTAFGYGCNTLTRKVSELNLDV